MTYARFALLYLGVRVIMKRACEYKKLSRTSIDALRIMIALLLFLLHLRYDAKANN